MTGLRPFFPFYGSKWNIARHYPAPAHDLVVEPFAGGAGYATFYGVPRAQLVDLDPIIVGVWSYLLRVSAAEILALPELPNVGDSVDDYPMLPQEARWLIGFWINRGSSTPAKSRTAYSARTDRGQLVWGARAKARIAQQLPALANWSIREGNYELADVGLATYFVDPPYGDKGRYYRKRFDAFDALGSWCRGLHGQAIVCEGPGATWLPFEPLGSFKSTRGRAEEFVWLSDRAGG